MIGWNTFWISVVRYAMPLVQSYHLLTSSIFFNIADEGATGLEKWGNAALLPFRYLFAGHSVVSTDGVHYTVREEVDYDHYFWFKTALCISLLPSSVLSGAVIKGMAYFTSSACRAKHQDIFSSLHCTDQLITYDSLYRMWGISVNDYREGEEYVPVGYPRRPGEEHILSPEKEGLRQIVSLLSKEKILFWVDCGTCLGAYRYGGVIPWDYDIDLAILQPDFDNVKRVLGELDPEKYQIQDWSSRNLPRSYLKVYIKESGGLIDIYHFAIFPEERCIRSIVANEGSIFLPESWKVRERRFAVATPFELVFPLKRCHFDGLEVPLPHCPEKYLQLRYGEDLRPIRYYNAEQNRYEKDPTHPYWKLPYVN